MSAQRPRPARRKDAAEGTIRGGVYLVVFRLPQTRTVRVGRLGRFRFEAGRYAYVGSAQRALAKRLARHARRRKARRWHVDYLAQHAKVEAALAWPLPKAAECRLAETLARRAGLRRAGPPGFGASDCRCAGHLLRLDDALDAGALAAALGHGEGRACCVSYGEDHGRTSRPCHTHLSRSPGN